jgi:ankyrin repeat protein
VEKGAIMPEYFPLISHAIRNGASTDISACLISAGADIDVCAEMSYRVMETPLCTAAGRGNLQAVQLLLEAGANPNGLLRSEAANVFELHGTPQIRFQSPLLCTLNGDTNCDDDLCDIVRLLLQFGGDPNISALGQDHRESPLITYPLQAAAKLDKIELVELLIQHKASVNSAYGTPALVVAISFSSIETVRLLLSMNTDPNGLGEQNYWKSALEAAVMSNDLDLINLLLKYRADVNECSSPHGGRTPLQRAAEIGSERVIKHLLQHGASMLSQPAPTNGISVLQGFVQNRLYEYVSKALEAGVSPNQNSRHGKSPLAAATVNNDIFSLHLLLAAGANVHEYAQAGFPSYRGEEALDGDFGVYAQSELSPIQWAAVMDSVEAAKILCEAGADVNQRRSERCGNMALHLAVRRRNYAMANFLIAPKAEVNAYSVGNTPAIDAIDGKDGSMLKLLVENGADPNQPGFHYSDELSRFSLLDYACLRENIVAVRVLLSAGAHTSQRCVLTSVFIGEELSGTFREEILEALLKDGADVNKRHYDDDSPLQIAISKEEFHCAYRLIEEGAYVNDLPSEGERGRTALQAAASVGDVDMVEHLLSKGANVNAPAAAFSGATALQAAAIKCYLHIAQILLEHGADIGAKAGIMNGRTAIEGAAEFGRIDMVKFLLDNYQGPEPISQMCARAFKAAEKQWFVMEQLTTYEHPGQAWPETTAGS